MPVEVCQNKGKELGNVSRVCALLINGGTYLHKNLCLKELREYGVFKWVLCFLSDIVASEFRIFSLFCACSENSKL